MGHTPSLAPGSSTEQGSAQPGLRRAPPKEWIPPAATDDGRRRRKHTDIVVRVVTANGMSLIQIKAKIDAAVDPQQSAVAVRTATPSAASSGADAAAAKI